MAKTLKAEPVSKTRPMKKDPSQEPSVKPTPVSGSRGVDGTPGVVDIALKPTYEFLVNADSLFVEYYDVLDSRWFIMIALMSQSAVLDKFFDTSIFEGLTDEELYEWYVGRRHYNPFYDIHCKVTFENDDQKNEFYTKMAYEQMTIRELFGFDCKLQMMDVLRQFMTTTPNMIKHIYVYEGPVANQFIAARVREVIPNSGNINFVHGDFEKCVNDVGKDTTYILADARKVETLIKMQRIELSTILISDGWRYNYTENMNKLIIDPEEMIKANPCRISYFNNYFTPDEADMK